MFVFNNSALLHFNSTNKILFVRIDIRVKIFLLWPWCCLGFCESFFGVGLDLFFNCLFVFKFVYVCFLFLKINENTGKILELIMSLNLISFHFFFSFQFPFLILFCIFLTVNSSSVANPFLVNHPLTFSIGSLDSRTCATSSFER